MKKIWFERKLEWRLCFLTGLSLSFRYRTCLLWRGFDHVLGARGLQRHPPPVRETSQATSCCRFPLVVNFREIGFDFVWIPDSFAAYFCSGECGRDLQHYSSHGQLVRRVNGEASGICCSPSSLSPLTLIVFDRVHNRLVIQRVQEMVTDSCRCGWQTLSRKKQLLLPAFCSKCTALCLLSL